MFVDIEKHLIWGLETHFCNAWTLNITWYQVWKLVAAFNLCGVWYFVLQVVDLAKHMVMGSRIELFGLDDPFNGMCIVHGKEGPQHHHLGILLLVMHLHSLSLNSSKLNPM
jgi:hypothetical protein